MTTDEFLKMRERLLNTYSFIIRRRRNRKLYWLIFKHETNTEFFAIKRVRNNGKYKFFANKI